jgi:imidazolonepropionase-like amidohydrolase
MTRRQETCGCRALLRCGVAAAVLYLCLKPAFTHAQTSAPQQSALVVTGVTLIDGTGSAAQPDRTVIIVGNRIEAIVDADAKAAIPKGARTVAARGQFLIPGLWDMHVHLRESDDG